MLVDAEAVVGLGGSAPASWRLLASAGAVRSRLANNIAEGVSSAAWGVPAGTQEQSSASAARTADRCAPSGFGSAPP